MDEVTKYINSFDGETHQRLKALRGLAQAAVPNFTEKISYGVPTICDQNGKYIAYFAGYKNFVSIYPIHLAAGGNNNPLQKYKSGKSTARFLNAEPLPQELIKKLFKDLYKAYLARK